MKTLIALSIAVVLSACSTNPLPSREAILGRVAYIQSLDCESLKKKKVEYEALSSYSMLDSESNYLAGQEILRRCKKP